jgi:tetratricopeptide (TPR) repeat protein
LLKLQGDLVEAEDLYREAVAISNRVLGGEHPATLNRMNNLVALLLVEDQLEEADTMSLAVVEVCRRRSELERASITLRAMHNRAAVLRALGDLGAAEAIIRETLELYRRLRGDEHPDTLTAINTLLVLLEDQGKLDEAEPMRRELIDAYHRSLGAHHPRTSIATVNLALLLDRQSKYEEAAQFFEQAIESMERTLPPHHQVLAFARGNLGRLLYRRQRYAEAEPLLLAAYEGFARSLGAEHEYTQYVVSDLIGLYDACGKPELAAAWQTRSATTQPAPAAGGD